MAKIVASYSQKMQAISSVVNFNFKHPEKLGPKNKAKISRIYNEIGQNTGFPIKTFEVKNISKARAAMAELNPKLKNAKWLKNPFISATDNENTELRFKGKKPYLVNKKAKAKINFFHFTDQELATKNFKRLEKFIDPYRKNPYIEARGKIMTKDGDFYSKKVNPQSLDQFADFNGYLGYIIANYGESLSPGDNHFIGEWLKGIEIVSFKKS